MEDPSAEGESDERAAKRARRDVQAYAEDVMEEMRKWLSHAWKSSGMLDDCLKECEFIEKALENEVSEREALDATKKSLEEIMERLKDRADAKEAVEAAFAAEGRECDFREMNPTYVATLTEQEQEEYIWSMLDPRIVKQTKSNGIRSFFPIQRGVLPHALRDANMDQVQPPETFRDLCVEAPTGSGKTLIYALTIHQALASRTRRTLRAVIVVPTRELARQAHLEMIRFAPHERHPAGTPRLRIALSAGKGTGGVFQRERPSLYMLPVCIASPVCNERPHPDILVVTPGRLVHHIDFTPGFTMQHVRYFVADEADRLVAQDRLGWAKKAIKACFNDSLEPAEEFEVKEDRIGEIFFVPDTRRSLEPYSGHELIVARLQKLLFSATLGDDPRQLNSFLLDHPKFFYLTDRVKTTNEPSSDSSNYNYVMSPTLDESTTVADAATKPLVLISALCQNLAQGGGGGVQIVFTNSVDTTLRVACLLRLYFEDDSRVAVFELSSALGAKGRDSMLEACRRRSGEQQAILVASDSASRGVDLEGVSLVVNYDMPTSSRSYVHRVGRTARAGKPGTSLTIVKKGQEQDFKRMRNRIIGATTEPRRRIFKKRTDLDQHMASYKACLGRLKDAVRAAKKGHRTERGPANEGEEEEEGDDEGQHRTYDNAGVPPRRIQADWQPKIWAPQEKEEEEPAPVEKDPAEMLEEIKKMRGELQQWFEDQMQYFVDHPEVPLIPTETYDGSHPLLDSSPELNAHLFLDDDIY